MGIHRLWQYLLSSSDKTKQASKGITLRKCRVLVDGESFINEITDRAYNRRRDLGQAEYFAQYIGDYQWIYQEALDYLDEFKAARVDLIFVFNCHVGDEGGQYKQERMEERRVSSLMEIVEVQESLLGRAPLGRSFKDRYLPLPPLATHQVKAAIRYKEFKIRQSFGEAGAALAFMLADEDPRECVGILTDSSDFLVFDKCRCIPYDCLEFGKEKGSIDARVFTPDQVASLLGLSPMQFLDAALLLGCDYTKHINSRIGLLSELEIEEHNPEAVAEFLINCAPTGLHQNDAFDTIWQRTQGLREAWEYASSLYALEQDPLTPAMIAKDDESKLALLKAVERRGLAPSIVEELFDQRFIGKPAFEAIYPHGEGRPAVMHILRPIRARIFGLLGLTSINMSLRDGTSFDDDKVNTISQKEDSIVLRKCLAGDVGEKDALRALELLTLQGYGHYKPIAGDGLSGIYRKTPHLYLAALALRLVALSSYNCISDQAERISKGDFLTLAATIVARQSSHSRNRSSKAGSLPSILSGAAVVEAASVSTWYCEAYALINILVSLLGVPRDIVAEPRDLFDTATYLALQARPPQPDEETMMLYNVAVEPLKAKGLDESLAFRPLDLPPRTWDDLPADPGAGRVAVMAANDMAIAEAEDGGGALREEDDDDELLRTTRKVDAILDKVDMSDQDACQRRKGLPILEYKDEIMSTIGNHLVTIIHGETGCGKSTQVPQYLLAGSPTAKIVVTQPTRLAAVGAAKRVASELNTELGQLVGYRIGGQGETSYQTRIIFATAGWLLQLLVHTGQEKPSFTHVVIDEVHERSIDSDLLCLVMKMLLRKWSDGTVRLILMSATMQGGIFEDYFGRDLGERVPRLSVGVKRYGVDEVYLEELSRQWPDVYRRRLSNSATLDSLLRKMTGRPDQPQIGPDALMLATQLTTHITRPGETCLIFVSGMSDIDELYKLLEAATGDGNRLEVLICHSMISLEEQVKAFTPNEHCGRVIIATNMAESSVTLPDVKYVLDFGVCKRIVYDQREHRTVLKACWISKASAKQRAGRTGRVCRGTCIRFYTRGMYECFDGYDPPEMLTQPLEQVVLRMKMLDFGDVQETLAQCVEPPNLEQVNNAVSSLFKMGALESADKEAKVTSLGYIVSSLGLDLAVARTVVLGVILGCPVEAAVLGAAIASQDPFIMPHPSSSQNDDVNDFFQLISKVTTARDYYARDLGSDPIALMCLYAAWLRMDNEYDRKAFLHRNGLVQTRMRSVDSVVRAILRSLSESGAVPSTWEMVSYMRQREFEASLMTPQRLFLLRCLLLGGFYGNLMSGHLKFKGPYDDEASRTLRLGSLPPALQDPNVIAGAVGAVGRIADIQIRDNAAYIIFAPAEDYANAGPWDSMGRYDGNGQQQQQILNADEDVLGRFRGIASPVKAIMNSRGHGGELGLICPRMAPGMPGYIPPGMPGYEHQEMDNRRRSIITIKDVQASATFNCKSVISGKAVSLPKGSVLRNSAIPRKNMEAPLYLVTSDIQKLVGKNDSASFRADNATYLPYSEALLALVVAAFSPDQPVRLFRPSNGTSRQNQDDSTEDERDYQAIEIGEPPFLRADTTLPSNTLKLINHFRSLVSACIGGKGKVAPSMEAHDVLMQFMTLASVDQHQQGGGGGGRGQITSKPPTYYQGRLTAEVYQVMEKSTMDVLPQLSRRPDPKPMAQSGWGGSGGHGVKRPHPDGSGVDPVVLAVAGILPQYPAGIGDVPLAKRLKKMGFDPSPDLPRLLHYHGFRVQGNKILAPPHGSFPSSVGGRSSSHASGGGVGNGLGPDINTILASIEQRGAEGLLLKTLWDEQMAFFKTQGVTKLKAVDRFLYRHGVTIRAERAFLNVPDTALPPVGSSSLYTAMAGYGGGAGGGGGMPMAMATPSSSYYGPSGGAQGQVGGGDVGGGGGMSGLPDDGIHEIIQHLYAHPSGIALDHLWSLIKWDGSWLAKSRIGAPGELLAFLAYHQIPAYEGIFFPPPGGVGGGAMAMNGGGYGGNGGQQVGAFPMHPAASGPAADPILAPILAMIREVQNGYRMDQLWGRIKKDRWWTSNARVSSLQGLLDFFQRHGIPTQDGKAFLPGTLVPTSTKVAIQGGKSQQGERLWARAGRYLVDMLAPAPKGLTIKEIYAKLKDRALVGLDTEVPSKNVLKTVLEGLPPESDVVVQELPELRVYYRPRR